MAPVSVRTRYCTGMLYDVVRARCDDRAPLASESHAAYSGRDIGGDGDDDANACEM